MIIFEHPLAARLVLPSLSPQRKLINENSTKKKDQIRRALSLPFDYRHFCLLAHRRRPYAPSSPDHERQRTPSKYPISRYAARLHARDSEHRYTDPPLLTDANTRQNATQQLENASRENYVCLGSHDWTSIDSVPPASVHGHALRRARQRELTTTHPQRCSSRPQKCIVCSCT